MKYILKNVIPLITGLGLVVILSVVTAACSSTTSPSTSSLLQDTTPTTTVTSPSPQTSQPSQFQRRGASGTIAAINGNILTLTTAQGQVTVNISSDTTIEKTINATVSDLSQGNFVSIGGTTDSLGNVDATSIMVRTQGLSDQSFPPITTTPGNGGNTTSPNSDFPGGNIGHQMTMGTIDDINGDIITVTTAQSQVTVNVGTDTVIQKTVSGTFSDLQIGDSLTIVGPTDDNGNITATSISIRPPGQSFPGIQSTNNPN